MIRLCDFCRHNERVHVIAPGDDGQSCMQCSAEGRSPRHDFVLGQTAWELIDVIDFSGSDWGGWAQKADTPGKPFLVNGVPCTLYNVEGRGPSWDGKPLFAIVFRREDAMANEESIVRTSAIPLRADL